MSGRPIKRTLRGQAAWRPDLDSEEVGGGEHVPVGREKLPPGRALLAFGGGF